MSGTVGCASKDLNIYFCPCLKVFAGTTECSDLARHYTFCRERRVAEGGKGEKKSLTRQERYSGKVRRRKCARHIYKCALCLKEPKGHPAGSSALRHHIEKAHETHPDRVWQIQIAEKVIEINPEDGSLLRRWGERIIGDLQRESRGRATMANNNISGSKCQLRFLQWNMRSFACTKLMMAIKIMQDAGQSPDVIALMECSGAGELSLTNSEYVPIAYSGRATYVRGGGVCLLARRAMKVIDHKSGTNVAPGTILNRKEAVSPPDTQYMYEFAPMHVQIAEQTVVKVVAIYMPKSGTSNSLIWSKLDAEVVRAEKGVPLIVMEDANVHGKWSSGADNAFLEGHQYTKII